MMDKLYIVVNGIEHQYFDRDSTGYYLISYDPLSENNGYKLFDSELKQYRKYLTEKQVEKKYKIIDHIWFNEQKWDIFQRSDDNLDKPNSWVTIVSDDIEFLNRNGLWKEENLVESRYGHLYYCSLPIEAEKFSLIRTRKNLPI
jgi:hypothetical protein